MGLLRTNESYYDMKKAFITQKSSLSDLVNYQRLMLVLLSHCEFHQVWLSGFCTEKAILKEAVDALWGEGQKKSPEKTLLKNSLHKRASLKRLQFG